MNVLTKSSTRPCCCCQSRVLRVEVRTRFFESSLSFGVACGGSGAAPPKSSIVVIKWPDLTTKADHTERASNSLSGCRCKSFIDLFRFMQKYPLCVGINSTTNLLLHALPSFPHAQKQLTPTSTTTYPKALRSLVLAYKSPPALAVDEALFIYRFKESPLRFHQQACPSFSPSKHNRTAHRTVCCCHTF